MVPLDPEEAQYVISKCCQKSLCEDCVFKPDIRGCRIISRCPNCQVPIQYADDIIKINGDTLEKMADDPDLITEAIKSENVYSKGGGENGLAHVSDKRELIRCLLTNTPFTATGDKEVPPFVTGLIDGVRSIPKTDKDPNKFLIYSTFKETTNKLQRYLADFGIKSKIYVGNRQQRDDLIEEFKTTLDILIMSDIENSAGLHLPFISHVIFYHNVKNDYVKKQLVGRAQRVGRTFDLSVITLQYGDDESY